ncbi:MAG: glycosyltransferase family 2 protein [Deltaproteobacteria bacterium]|jgi:dTDP-glucose pyrophosphorylase|nr:glycosyltransferase family 2 protein [Deltaproteobacteria bacterium]
MQIMFLMGSSQVEINKEDYPLYLTEIGGKLILEQQIEYCQSLNPQKYIFCVKNSDLKAFQVDSVIRQLIPDAKIIPINNQTQGAVCTALLGSQDIDNTEELILMAIDDFIEDSGRQILELFHQKNSDAGVVSFNSVHPRYSFAKLDDQGNVIEVAEKHPISKNALVSFYYFKKESDFVVCAKEVIRKDNPINGVFYISQTLNEMILKQKKVSCCPVANNKFHPLKTEAQLAEYLLELKEKKDSK